MNIVYRMLRTASTRCPLTWPFPNRNKAHLPLVVSQPCLIFHRKLCDAQTKPLGRNVARFGRPARLRRLQVINTLGSVVASIK